MEFPMKLRLTFFLAAFELISVALSIQTAAGQELPSAPSAVKQEQQTPRSRANSAPATPSQQPGPGVSSAQQNAPAPQEPAKLTEAKPAAASSQPSEEASAPAGTS